MFAVKVTFASVFMVPAALAGWIQYAERQAPTKDQMRTMITAPEIKREISGEDKCLFPIAITAKNISRPFRQVLLGAEDRSFSENRFGLNLRGLGSAVLSLGHSRGGSSIAQQLVKNVLFEPSDNRWKRKAFEIPWTILLNERFSKDEILAGYLNHIPFRHGLYGVEAASLYYFHKHAAALNYLEGALIEVMLSSPRTDIKHQDAAIREATMTKAKNLLKALVRDGIIPASALTDKIQAGQVEPPATDCGYVRDFVVSQIDQRRIHEGNPAADLGPLYDGPKNFGSSFRVFLGLDASRQAAARSALGNYLGDLARKGGSQMAIVDLNRNGSIQVLQGGFSYGQSQWDRTTAPRSPGSVGKVVVLAEACEQGLTLDSPVHDDPFASGRPKNDDNRYLGKISIRLAFQQSRNAAFFRLAKDLGPQKVAQRAIDMGLSNDRRKAWPSDGGIAIGDFDASLLELTAAINVIANGGVYVRPYVILGISGAYGESSYWHQPDKRVVLSVRCARMVDEAMRSVVTAGTGRNADIDQARGKTGTSKKSTDAWFLGYTKSSVTGVWAGNDKPQIKMNNVMGGGIPARAFKSFVSGGKPIGKPASPVPVFKKKPPSLSLTS